ncbi:PAS domain S-box protein [Halovenus marina]|uniref:PAS domain-containing sensor histidine kinase n=1 Tax=Halovenus marina TaxID=3396621 RepID=UPI003F56C014
MPEARRVNDRGGDGIEGITATTTVLVVDDDGEFAQLVGAYLEDEHGFEVQIETDATAALDLLRRSSEIDCVVSDYAMPEMDGLELLQAVKEHEPELPFVLFAGQGSEHVASEAIHLGADDYLEKDTGEKRYELLATRIENCVTIARQQQTLQDLYAAIEHAGHAILVTDTDGTITYANPTMEELSGYDLSELRGDSPAILNSGEHDDDFYRDLWETITAGEIWTGEITNERKDGERYVIDQTIAPITNAGEITGFVAINRDITERRARERELRMFREAVEQAGHAILVTDTDGTIEYVNPAFEEMTGYDRDTTIGNTPAILKSGEHDDAFYRDLWGAICSGEVWNGEIINERKDGERYVIDQTIAPITDDGDLTGFVAINRDITERKERERELRMFREAVEQAGHAVVVTDTDGTIEYVNPAFEEMTGYDRDTAIGNTPAILKSGEHDDAFYRDLWETVLDGEVWQGEVINEREDGERYVIDQTIAPLTDDGELTGFVAVNRDITELKEQQRELQRQNDRLENFGRTVAHDLRNPLNVMDVHLEEAKAADDPGQAHNEIRTAIDRMSALIDELLALAKHGKSVLDPKPESLAIVTQAAWDHVNTQAMTLTVDSDATLLMDMSRVTELFENLFRNAREHAGADAAVHVGTLGDGFYVEDDGPGIPPNKRDGVLESGVTTSEDGTGFGLAIVSQIAEAHDWEITVCEGRAGGARFEFHDVTQADHETHPGT